MKLISISPPISDELGSETHSRPILAVKYHGQRLTYAVFRNGRYEFSIEPSVGEAVDEGLVSMKFDLDYDNEPIGITLSDSQELPDR